MNAKAPKKTLSAEQLQKREQSAYARRIRSVFTNAGFVSLPSNNIHRMFGDKKGELDHIFVYDNIIVIAEDTVGSNARTHLKNKALLFREIRDHKKDFVDWVWTEFRERMEKFDEYDFSRYRLFFLYFSKHDLVLSAEDVKLFEPTTVVRSATLAYLTKMSQNIRQSSRTDIFRFLKVQSADLGPADDGSKIKKISTPIIYPNDNTGLKNGVRVVSFMMSADMLLRNSYVLRKDNWEDTIELYQRLIEKDRIQKIRTFVAKSKSTFINNIIVSLPRSVEFRDDTSSVVDIAQISNYENLTMHVPDEMNSICIIDGQHRIFAHYEGVDALESEMVKLRKKFHLLVTGLIFPPSMTVLEQRKFESQLFLDINSNARPVPQDVLLFIETLKDPFSDLGVARRVLERMNERSPFMNEFQLSLMDDSKIKIASIIKFALRYVVAVTSDQSKLSGSLFSKWESETERAALLKDAEEKKDTTRLDSYIEYCAATLARYFSGVRDAFPADWTSPDSKIKSTVSINGFLLALRKGIDDLGNFDVSDVSSRLGKVSVDFSKDKFPFTASQYAKFSRQILGEAFNRADA